MNTRRRLYFITSGVALLILLAAVLANPGIAFGV